MKMKKCVVLLFATLTLPMIGNANSGGEGTVQMHDKANISVASVYDDKDQPCYAGGQYVANCSRNSPYYNVLNGECYSSLQECKQADGDLSNTQGNGSCVRCGK